MKRSTALRTTAIVSALLSGWVAVPAWAALSYQTWGPMTGIPVDIRGDEALAVDNGRLIVRTLSTSLEQVVYSDPAFGIKSAFLMSHGVIFNAVNHPADTPASYIYEIRDGALVNADPSAGPGNHAYPTDLHVSGDFAEWSTDHTTSPFDHVLLTRNLDTGTNATVANYAGNVNNDVTSTGDVVFWGNGSGDYNIWRYAAGITTLLTGSSLYPINVYPRSAGAAGVVFRSLSGPDNHPDPPYPTYAIDFVDAGGVVSHLTQWPDDYVPQPGANYAADPDGWVAFMSHPALDSYDLYTRSPAGVISLVSHLATNTESLRVAPDGSIAYSTIDGLFLASPADASLLVGSADNSLAVWQSDHWDVVSGGLPEPSAALLLPAAAASSVLRRRR